MAESCFPSWTEYLFDEYRNHDSLRARIIAEITRTLSDSDVKLTSSGYYTKQRFQQTPGAQSSRDNVLSDRIKLFTTETKTGHMYELFTRQKS